MKKLITVFIVLFFSLSFYGCKSNKPKLILILEENEIIINEGETYQIKASLQNGEANIIYKIIIGDDCITLENNFVHSIKSGNAEVEVSVEGNPNIKDTVSIEIKANPKIIVNTKEIVLNDDNKTTTINAYAINTEAKIIYSIIEGKELITLENNVVSSKEIISGQAIVRASIEGLEDIYEDITIEVVVPIDETAPEFKLESTKDLKLNWGKEVTKEFLMQGITAMDDIDGDITDKVVITEDIDNKKYGMYEVKYEITDEAGNSSSLIRNVEVVWDYAVEFIGHQGSYYGVANTEEAFIYAAQVLKYQALETDVKQTKDGVFVCCHDDTFGGVNISDVTWDELKDIEVTSSRTAGFPKEYGEIPGNGKYKSKICSLERYLEICKQYGVKAVVELKGSQGISNSSQTRMPALMELIKSEDMLSQTIFLASAYNCLIWVKENGYNYIPCQYLVGSCESEEIFERCKKYGLDISVNTTYGDYSNSPEWIARYQDAGLKVSTYTYTQYVDYDVVQYWIDLGVDFVTCDWHSMDKLNLPDNSNITLHSVKFYDVDHNLLKESKVKSGRAAAAPTPPSIAGYEFVGWSESIKNVKADLEVTAEYELIDYNITYDSNLYVLSKSKWETKEEFVDDFYNDLFNWIVNNKDNLPCVTFSNGTYNIKVNSTEYGSAQFSSAKDIKDTYVYNFERTFATLIYKPINGTNSEDYIPEIDNNYFLNTEPYRTKYSECNKYFLNVMQTAYSTYSQTYNQASNNRVQIFFRFHQWCNGSSISAFDSYPEKYLVKYLTGVSVAMPTEPVKYTIEDQFIIPEPSSSIEFLGWYTDRNGESEPIKEIKKGTTGDLILYAKWEKVDIPEVYFNIKYDLDEGTNNPLNKDKYLQGITTSLYPAYKEGYKFIGWSKEKNSNSYISIINEFESGDITLYANYEYEEYNIKYDLQGGTWGTKAEFVGDATTSIVTDAKDGFWENGYSSYIYLNSVDSYPKALWSFRVGLRYDDVFGMYVVESIGDSGKSFDDTTSDYVISISGSYKNYSQTSSFRSNIKIGQVVKIDGDLDSGKATLEFYSLENITDVKVDNYITEYNISLLPIKLPEPKLEGKVFKGWSLKLNDTNNVITELPVGTIGDITLFAIYE